MIKDSKGKSHMVFDKDDSNEEELMGDKVDDYEILQVLGEGSFGFVAKAKSKLNHKIYAIKQINFATLKSEKAMELSKNEMIILKNLNFPLITKYFKSIEEGNCLYIIMEFMNNGDLNGLIKAHKILNKPIEEEKLWDIFIQAMRSLAFIHSKNLVHRDIKPENLFINNDGTVKLGDFGVSASVIEKNKNKIINAQKELISNWQCNGTCVGTPPFMSPEMLKKTQYDLKTDVYSMGCTFFESMFWMFPRTPIMDVAALFGGSDTMKLVDIPIKNNKDYYSKELVDIIYKMIEIDKNNRPSSEEVLNMLIHEFNKKYGQNSSIGSIICCLYCFQELTYYFMDEENNVTYINNTFKSLPICASYLFGIKQIIYQANNDWNSCLCNIRAEIVKENNRYDGNKEIEPRQILSFFLGRMHKELNKCKNNYVNEYNRLFTNNINDNSNEPNQQNNINFSNKIEAYNDFINRFNQNNKSIISDNFYGVMKNKTVCSKCKLTTYTYNSFVFVSFNLNLIQKKIQQNYNQTNIIQCFTLQNNECITLRNNIYCRSCKINSIHYQRKQFYNLPRFLIICLDRGIDCQNKMNVNYGIDINLRGNCDNSNSPLHFKLIGVIKRLDLGEKEHYISIYFDFQMNCWIFRNDSENQKINSPFDVKQGYEVMFFYIENKNYFNNQCFSSRSTTKSLNSNISNNNINNGINMNMNNNNINVMNSNIINNMELNRQLSMNNNLSQRNYNFNN